MKHVQQRQSVISYCRSQIGVIWFIFVALGVPGFAAESLHEVEQFPLPQVRLRDGIHSDIQKRSAEWIRAIDPARVLHLFRLNAKLPTDAKPLGGWESDGHVLRGAFGGHYLSICAQLYEATGDPAFKQRVDVVVAGLAECQRGLGESGYLCAYPESSFDYAEAGEPGRQGISSVPFYTVHKIMAGLEQAHRRCNSELALKVRLGMARWTAKRTARLSYDHMQQFLNIEHGGMLEMLLNLYEETGDKEFLDTATRFEHKRIFDPLLGLDDSILLHLHGNSTVPKILGATRAYELLGEPRYRQLSEFFWEAVVKTRSYVTGNSTNREHWGHRSKLADELSVSTTESCVAHNMMKLTGRMFQWEPRASLMDYYERTMFGHILATQHPESGATMWYLPLASGYWKWYASHIHLCCTGTLNESFATFGENVYYHNPSSLYVTQFVASELSWPEKGLTLIQETDFPESGAMTFTFKLDKPVDLQLMLRYPGWATAGGSLTLNGEEQAFPNRPGSFHAIKREWQNGDTLQVEFPMPLRAWPLPDDSNQVAFLAGPVVLAGRLGTAGLTPEMIDGSVNPHDHRPIDAPSLTSLVGEEVTQSISKGSSSPREPLADASDYQSSSFNLGTGLLTPVDGKTLSWRIGGQGRDIELVPLYRLHGERYAVYWKSQSEDDLADKEDKEIPAASIYRTKLPTNGRVDLRTRVDLLASMNLAGKNLIDCLDPDYGYRPRRAINLIRQDEKIQASYDGCFPYHDLGRCWDALLRLEGATDYRIPAGVEAPLLETTKRYFDNPLHVMVDPDPEKSRVDQHSFREHLLTLNELIRNRESTWAREKSTQMIESILSGRTPHKHPDHVLSGRMIEALIWNFEITGNPDALRLAQRYAESHLDNVTNPEGTLPLKKGHTHSYLGTLRGLLLYGELTQQPKYIDRVLKTYRNGVTQQIITRSGFTAHDIGGPLGETGSGSDVAQLALWLAMRHGQVDLFDDVERIVRARLLPSQVIHTPKLTPRNDGKSGPVYDLTSPPDQPLETTADTFRNLEQRIIGGYGGCHRQPHGWKTVTTDVTAANIQTLLDVHQHTVLREPGAMRVLFHFDYTDDTIEIRSVRTAGARVNIRLSKPRNLFVRIPAWTPRDSVQIEVAGQRVLPEWQGQFVFLPRDLFPAQITLSYALPLHEESETIAGTKYELLWRGDEVVGVRPNDVMLPFYPTWPDDLKISAP